MRSGKKALWAIEAVISVNMIYLSLLPVIRDFETGFDPAPGVSNLQYFIQGAGLYTSGFWLRLVAIFAALVLITNWPGRKNRYKRLKWRTRANLVMFALFSYVTVLAIIFVPAPFWDMIWIQSFVYAVIMGIGYLANSAEMRLFAKIKNARKTAESRDGA